MHCKMETSDGRREMSDTLSEREMMREDGGDEARMEAGGWRLLRCVQERQTTTTNKRQARMDGKQLDLTTRRKSCGSRGSDSITS